MPVSIITNCCSMYLYVFMMGEGKESSISAFFFNLVSVSFFLSASTEKIKKQGITVVVVAVDFSSPSSFLILR